jgi:hypothetical protein
MEQLYCFFLFRLFLFDAPGGPTKFTAPAEGFVAGAVIQILERRFYLCECRVVWTKLKGLDDYSHLRGPGSDEGVEKRDNFTASSTTFLRFASVVARPSNRSLLVGPFPLGEPQSDRRFVCDLELPCFSGF